MHTVVALALHDETMQPPDDLIDYASRIGATVAMDRQQFGMADDMASEAVLGLLVEWPKIVSRYGPTPPKRIVATIVKRRLTDWLRLEYGRRHRKPHADAVVLLNDEGGAIELPDPNDGFDGAGEIDLTLEELIDVVVMAVGDDQRPTMEVVCRGLAAGQPLAEIAATLDVTESRASQLVAELGVKANSHAFVRSVLVA